MASRRFVREDGDPQLCPWFRLPHAGHWTGPNVPLRIVRDGWKVRIDNKKKKKIRWRRSIEAAISTIAQNKRLGCRCTHIILLQNILISREL